MKNNSIVSGISEEKIKTISRIKEEPEWMTKKRLEAYNEFKRKKMPSWPHQPSININFDSIIYYKSPESRISGNWDDIPQEIKKTFDDLGIPEAEKKALGGVGAQYESEAVYHRLKERLIKKGVIFEDMGVAVKKYPSIVKEYFGKCIGINDHKLISLHYAVWSGGTFIYVPKNIKVTIPLQAYFRMNTKGMGQFEHTLIIVDEGAELHYIEGCSAPLYDINSLHAGAVEIFVKKNAHCRYSSVENWSKNTYNLNTKRAVVESNGKIIWVGGNLGSGATMLYPASILRGKGASAEHLGIAYAGPGQDQDVGAKVYHIAPNTRSIIRSKSISAGGGRTNYRGHVFIREGAEGAVSNVDCDALMIDNESSTDTMPYIEVNEKDSDVFHEAKTGRISEEKIDYLTSKGINENDAKDLIINGFIEDILKELPIEYAVELNKLISMEIKSTLG